MSLLVMWFCAKGVRCRISHRYRCFISNSESGNLPHESLQTGDAWEWSYVMTVILISGSSNMSFLFKIYILILRVTLVSYEAWYTVSRWRSFPGNDAGWTNSHFSLKTLCRKLQDVLVCVSAAHVTVELSRLSPGIYYLKLPDTF
jgi:hypothetical protein